MRTVSSYQNGARPIVSHRTANQRFGDYSSGWHPGPLVGKHAPM